MRTKVFLRTKFCSSHPPRQDAESKVLDVDSYHRPQQRRVARLSVDTEILLIFRVYGEIIHEGFNALRDDGWHLGDFFRDLRNPVSFITPQTR